MSLGFNFSFFDFPLGHRSGQYMWEDHRPRSGVWKGTSGGEAISFSGCDDNETSADTSVSLIIHNSFYPYSIALDLKCNDTELIT